MNIDPMAATNPPTIVPPAYIPCIPKDVAVANRLPAETAPITLYIPAATDPAVIPTVPNPKAIGIEHTPATIIPPIIKIVPSII